MFREALSYRSAVLFENARCIGKTETARQDASSELLWMSMKVHEC